MNNSQKGFIAPLLLILIVVLLIGGGTYVFTKQQNQPTVVNTSTISSYRPLGGFDSYGNLASQYAVDNTHAYYKGMVMRDTDPETLEVIKGSLQEMKGFITYEYAKDARTVYYQGIPLSGVVLASFRPIENGYSVQSYGTDGQTVYFYSYPIAGADLKTFKILWQTVWEGCPDTSYSKDTTHVYFDSFEYRMSKVVPGADPETFASLAHGFGKDKRGYYEGANYLGPTMDLSKLVCEVG